MFIYQTCNRIFVTDSGKSEIESAYCISQFACQFTKICVYNSENIKTCKLKENYGIDFNKNKTIKVFPCLAWYSQKLKFRNWDKDKTKLIKGRHKKEMGTIF